LNTLLDHDTSCNWIEGSRMVVSQDNDVPIPVAPEQVFPDVADQAFHWMLQNGPTERSLTVEIGLWKLDLDAAPE